LSFLPPCLDPRDLARRVCCSEAGDNRVEAIRFADATGHRAVL